MIRFYATFGHLGTFKVDFNQPEYVADNGSVCVGLNLISQSLFDHNITVELSIVNDSTDCLSNATGM